MKDADKTAIILEALKERYSNLIWAQELALYGGARRCDFWTLHPHRSKGYHATAYEIKVSKIDFKRDTYEKQRSARLFSDEFYYVTPKGLIKINEIPDWAGLLEFNIKTKQWSCKLEAPMRDKDAPSWELVVSIIRNSREIRRDTDVMKNQIRELERRLKKYQEKERNEWKKFLEKQATKQNEA